MYELGGDERVSYPEMAQAISNVTGKSVEYRNLPVAEYQGVLESVGLPAQVAAVLADAGIATGVLDVTRRGPSAAHRAPDHAARDRPAGRALTVP
ncbi:uncharacterized protein YbjT (DUF2867 family) [Rhodococcus sp. LBL1]|nr:uncharacterized protein YbjT (DUF2867 family) [Rhodococcus sp. LBL1]MDH6685892.1 uncharacterized protein YbjT (DUF2867 family) [Rhodococcus sp. LBL2]